MPGCQRKSTEKNTEKQPDDAGQPGRKEISMKGHCQTSLFMELRRRDPADGLSDRRKKGR